MKIITGMHRSGTSCVANLALELGADFGEPSTLLAGDEWNEKGYFENPQITFFNDGLLLGEYAESEKWWHSAESERTIGLRLRRIVARVQYFFFFSRAVIAARARARNRRLRELAAAAAGQTVKDVRFSLVLEHWRRTGVVEGALFCVRHPREVALSLQKRNGLPLSLGYGQWLRYNREFFRQAEGLPVTVIDYNRLFDPELRMEEARRITSFLGSEFQPGRAETALDKVVSASLKKNEGGEEELPDKVARVYKRLAELHRQYSAPAPLKPVGRL